LVLLESHKTAQQAGAHDLAEERSRRERAEASETGIRQAMVFKDAVIQEVHHRVKNTIQIAASLLSLQARTTSSAEARVALQEGYRRLNVLAKVHELLYRSADSVQEILMPKLLRTMGDALRESFSEKSTQVRLRVTSDQILLSPDDAIPMALLANELMTNAYKHAFPDDSSGEITVNLRYAPENALILQISDNGIGMPAASDENSLGLELIRSFAAQLQGTLSFAKPDDADGTKVTLTIHRQTQRRVDLERFEPVVATMS
jgi:two-component sensor histidine kinase